MADEPSPTRSSLMSIAETLETDKMRNWRNWLSKTVEAISMSLVVPTASLTMKNDQGETVKLGEAQNVQITYSTEPISDDENRYGGGLITEQEASDVAIRVSAYRGSLTGSVEERRIQPGAAQTRQIAAGVNSVFNPFSAGFGYEFNAVLDPPYSLGVAAEVNAVTAAQPPNYLNSGTVYGEISASRISASTITVNSVTSEAAPSGPMTLRYFDTLPSPVGFNDGELAICKSIVYRKLTTSYGLQAWMPVDLQPKDCQHDFDLMSRICRKCRCTAQFLEQLTPTPARCAHTIDPISRTCKQCGAGRDSLERLAMVCTGEGTCHGPMKLDYMASGLTFCEKCGLFESEIEMLTAPVVAGDEAARQELTKLPAIEDCITEREV